MPRYLISLIGQSNEMGAGPAGSKSRTSGVAAPYIDASQRSWWASCIETVARKGVWLDVVNTAVASTALTDSWVGRCRLWGSGLIVTRGSYLLSSGGIWRCALAAGTAAASTTQPTGTADTTGADAVPWIYLGIPTSADVDGGVYPRTSARYDPNGYIAAALAGLANRPGYDVRGVYLSIGQGDHTVSATRAQYATAMQQVAAQISSLGYVCWLGVTCGMSGVDAPTIAARDATMTGVIQAGQRDALVALAGNSLVRAGADLRAALGVPSATATDTALNSVNNTDYLHLTSASYDQAGKFVAASLVGAD